MTCIAVFSNVAGIGKTTLVYHLGHMLAELGKRVLLVDCDPQATLTSLCLPEERIEALWQGELVRRPTIAGFITAVQRPETYLGHLEEVCPNLALIPGDIGLAALEHLFADAWAHFFRGEEIAAVDMGAFFTVISAAQRAQRADVVLLDLASNLGSINRAAVVSVNHVLCPLTPSLLSIQSLQTLGPILRGWRERWQSFFQGVPAVAASLDPDSSEPLGYVVTQTGMRLMHPIPAYPRWAARLPGAYRQAMGKGVGHPKSFDDDPACLGIMHHYAGLMPLALDARKPMFDLRPADGAIGSHMDSVQRCRDDYERLAKQILTRTSP